MQPLNPPLTSDWLTTFLPSRHGSRVRHLSLRDAKSWLVVLVVGFYFATTVLAQPPVVPAGPKRGPTDEEVRRALDQGVKFLKSKQLADGRWVGYDIVPTGLTSLCTLALLNAGVPANDPSIRKALDFLRAHPDLEMTYGVSLQTMVFCAADPRQDMRQILKNVHWLQGAQRGSAAGENNGGWGYRHDQSEDVDNSNSQFALLALHEAELAGATVLEATWRRALDYWQRQQNGDGSFGYEPDGANATGSMTCAGVGSLIISLGHVGSLDASIVNQQVQCCGGGQQDPGDAVEKGLAWLGRNFSAQKNPASEGTGERYYHYYMYALERVGRLAGRRFIGQHDWYREGVESLLRTQDPLSNHWNGDDTITSTAFAVLFLSKGRRPILISKVQREPADDWNHHRHDMAHLTHHVERRWKQDLTWQIVDIRNASSEELWSSPVLFLTGRKSLVFTPQEKQALQEYINLGGFLFAENCCDGTEFDQSFRALMTELFPDSPLRLLPPDHPIWFAEERVDPKYMDTLLGIDACCRTGVVYSPKNLSCYWELAVPRQSTTSPISPEIQAEIDARLSIGTNVVTYATGRVLRRKLETPLPSVIRTAQHDRAALHVAKILHGGGSDDAPGSLTNLLNLVGQQTRLPVSTEKTLLSLTDPNLLDYPIAFVHGRRSFRWSTQERAGLRNFVDSGGVIMADAICADAAFATSFREEMRIIFPEAEWTRVPPEHPMFGTTYHGHDIRRVTLRDPKRRARRDDPLSVRTESVAPLLEGIEKEGRYVVLFSPNDLSCALENRPSLECRGYISEDAAKIGTNMILYSMH